MTIQLSLVLPYFLGVFLAPVSAQGLDCYVPGFCKGINIGGLEAPSYNLCLEQCKNTPNCNYISYLTLDKDCVGFFDCPTLDPSYPQTFSSQVGCGKRTVCNEPGRCFGNTVQLNITDTVEACIDACSSSPDCLWWSYLSLSRNCFLTSDCIQEDFTCTDCYHGERACSVADENILFVIGRGNPLSTEVIDLSGNERTCTQPTPCPLDFGSVGTFTNDKALVCSSNNGTTETLCFEYENSTNSWSRSSTTLIEGRYLAGSIYLSPEKWWLLGGGRAFNGITTEIYHTGNRSTTLFSDLPEGKSLPRLMDLNSTHILMVGDVHPDDVVHIYDKVNEKWSVFTNIPLSFSEPVVGIATKASGEKILVVSGGSNSEVGIDVNGKQTMIYSFDSNQWAAGPDIPVDNYIAYASCVQWRNSFLVLGGEDGRNNYRDSIFTFDPDLNNWIIMNEKLSTGLTMIAAFFVPEGFIQCS